MQSDTPIRRLIATTVLRDDRSGFDRWAGSLIHALATASAEGAFSWRIAVQGADEQFLYDAALHARANGGDVDWVNESGVRTVTANGDLILEIDPDVLILPSTVARLLQAFTDDGPPVAARILTVPPAEVGPAIGCVLAGVESQGVADVRPEAIGLRIGDQAPLELDSGMSTSLAEDAAVAAGHMSPPSDSLTSEAVSLSVVMRTQVRRPEALREALLCLNAQSDGRFELLLVVHDRDVAAAAAVVAEQAPWLGERLRVLEATGGTRSRPLNVGFAQARGTHVAVLDDDDVVSATWVSDLLGGARRYPRRAIRTVVGVQQASAAIWNGGVEGHVMEGAIVTPYPVAFNLVDHLRVNQTPFMAFAFPREAIDALGGADEDLEVCEDWDLVLRITALCGVVDLPRLTAIYRRWTTGADSYSDHSIDTWKSAMGRVRAKLDASPLVLPPGSASQLADLSSLRPLPGELAEVYASSSWQVTAPLRALVRLLRRHPSG